MIHKSFFTLALVCAGSAALADCPQNMADTGDGVFVSFSDFYVRYDRQADGSVIEQEVYFDDGTGFRLHSVAGAFVLQSWETLYGSVVNNTAEVTTYAVGADNLPTLFPGLTWQGSTVRQHDDGTTNVETVDVLMEPERTMTIGGCSYQSWPMRVSTTGTDGGGFIDRLTYLPSLGLAIYHGGSDVGEAFTPDTPVSISTEPPQVSAEGTPMVTAAPPPVNPTPANPPAAPEPSK